MTEMIFPCLNSHFSATKALHDRVMDAGFLHRESSVLNEEGQWKFPHHFRLENFLNDHGGGGLKTAGLRALFCGSRKHFSQDFKHSNI